MKSKIKLLIILFVCFDIVPVFASNSIDYNLTITDDFEFQEVINYRIEDYKTRANGYNYMQDIINNDIYADILGKTKYEKQKSEKDGVYYVTLKKTFNEYTMSNSAFMNNCFQSPKYEYDMNKYSFSGKGGFNCFDANNMTLTITTNFTVNSSNATVTDNKYVWNPTDTNFTMNIDISKKYKEAKIDPTQPYDDIPTTEDAQKNNGINGNGNTEEDNSNKELKKKKQTKVALISFGVITGMILVSLVFIIPVLKHKNNSLNKI